MCSISGVLISSPERDKEIVLERLQGLILRGEDRGRDSWGLAGLNKFGDVFITKHTGRPSNSAKLRLGDFEPWIMINNNRAEPTTEYVEEKTEENIQPFQYGDWIVAHNGVIANDKIIITEKGLAPKSLIDSAVLPALFDWELNTLDPARLAQILKQQIVGSFALAIIHRNFPNELILACNYKPLFLILDKETDSVFFTSLEEYAIPDCSVEGSAYNWGQVIEIPPYTLVHLKREKDLLAFGGVKIKSYDLRKENLRNAKKALVVCSGGLDSVTAAWMMKKKGYEVTLCHFKYGCRAEVREVEAIINVADAGNFGVVFLDMSYLFKQIGGSKLTNTGTSIKIAPGEAGAEFAIEWVPARNLIMLSVATGYAESHGFNKIVLGNNLEEAGAYPDNEQIFIHKFNSILPHAVQVDKDVEVLMPVGNLMKHEIVKLGMSIEAPLHLTWSCYEGGEIHCGNCGPCYMRKKGFKMAKYEEVIPYAYEGE